MYTLSAHIVDHAILGVVSGGAAPVGANPTATLGLSAVPGIATTYMRSDAAPALDVGIVPTWTGIHTFSAKDVHNAGVSLGLSGVLTSAVVDGAGAIGVLIQPATTYTVTNPPDRYISQIKDAAGTFLWSVASDGSLGAQITSHAGTALLEIGAAATALSSVYIMQGIKFGPKWAATAGLSITVGWGSLGANTVAAGVFDATDNVSATATTLVGGVFSNNAVSARAHSTVAGLVTTAYSGPIASATVAHGNLYGAWIRKPGGASGTGSTATNAYGLYVEPAVGLRPATTNVYGIYLDEDKSTTVASTIVNGIFLASATAAYKAIVIRDQNAWIGSSAAAQIDIGATNFKVQSANIGFFNHAVAAQPSAYTPSNVSADRSFDANSTTIDELADVLGTLIADLQTMGLVA